MECKHTVLIVDDEKMLRDSLADFLRSKGFVVASVKSGVEAIAKSLDAQSSFFFIDPPYFVKGQTLYLNALDEEYHIALSAQLKCMLDAAWVLTYDDCAEIRRLYRGWATIRSFSLRYVAAQRRSGKEVLISPKWIHLPTSQTSAAVSW